MKNFININRRAVLTIFSLILVVVACNRDSFDNAKPIIVLTSPSGIQIANSFSDLSNIVAKHFVKPEFKYNKIEIKEIEYLEIPGFSVSAIVSYQIDNLPISNYGYFRKIGDSSLKQYKSLNTERVIIMKCVASGGCDQSSCLLMGTIDPNTGTQTTRCSCAECILETIID